MVLGGAAIPILVRMESVPRATSILMGGFEFYWIVGLAGSILLEAQRRAERRAAANAEIAEERWRALIQETEQRREAEEVAAHAQEQLRMAFQHAPVGICQIGLDGRIVEVNPTFCTITGWARIELLRRPFAEVVEAGDGGAVRELEYRRRDGSTVWIAVVMSGMPCPDERTQCAVAVVEDITARKRSEEQMVRNQKSESVALLAGGIAHDFNNLLTAVLGNATLAMDTVPPDGEARKMLDGVVSAGERAARLTSQLLAYAGRGAFAPADIDLSTAVSAACDLVRPSVPGRVRLKLELHEGLLRMCADSAQVQQLVTNLVLNAMEAIGEERPGVITMRTGRRRFEEAPPAAVGEVFPGDYLFVEVQDDGSGIEETNLARIFEPFFTTRFLGRGLGLAAVAGIVRTLKGAVLVSTAAGVGSTFTVVFPVR
jgi:PAS domain S-box-containing protein